MTFSTTTTKTTLYCAVPYSEDDELSTCRAKNSCTSPSDKACRYSANTSSSVSFGCLSSHSIIVVLGATSNGTGSTTGSASSSAACNQVSSNSGSESDPKSLPGSISPKYRPSSTWTVSFSWLSSDKSYKVDITPTKYLEGEVSALDNASTLR